MLSRWLGGLGLLVGYLAGACSCLCDLIGTFWKIYAIFGDIKPSPIDCCFPAPQHTDCEPCCPGGHQLQAFFTSLIVDGDHRRGKCDVCKHSDIQPAPSMQHGIHAGLMAYSGIRRRTLMYGCRLCNYDVCLPCLKVFPYMSLVMHACMPTILHMATPVLNSELSNGSCNSICGMLHSFAHFHLLQFSVILHCCPAQ